MEYRSEIDWIREQSEQARRDYWTAYFKSIGMIEEDAQGWAEKAVAMDNNGCSDQQIKEGLAYREERTLIAV